MRSPTHLTDLTDLDLRRANGDTLIKVQRNKRWPLPPAPAPATRCANSRLSDSPRKRSPLEKWAPVYVWAKSLLTFGRRHLSRCHYGDIPPLPGATTGPGSLRESGRATGLSFLGIIRAKIAIPLSRVPCRDLGQPSREVTGRWAFSENPGTSFAVTSKYCTHIARTREVTRHGTRSGSPILCLHRELSRLRLDEKRSNSTNGYLNGNLTR